MSTSDGLTRLDADGPACTGASATARMADDLRLSIACRSCGEQMSIIVNSNTKVITQGMTGETGTFHTQQALDYGTQMVGGVTPGKGGTSTSDCRFSIRSARRSRRPAPTPSSSTSRRPSQRIDHRGDRRRSAADRHHHRGHSGAGHGAGEARARRLEVAADRARTVRASSLRASARSGSCPETSSGRAASASSAAPAR